MAEQVAPENFICSECDMMVTWEDGVFECDCSILDDTDLDKPDAIPDHWSAYLCSGCDQPVTELGTAVSLPDFEKGYMCAQCVAFAEAAGDTSNPLIPPLEGAEAIPASDPE